MIGGAAVTERGARDAPGSCWRPAGPASRNRDGRGETAKGESESRRRASAKRNRQTDMAKKYLIETFGCQMNVHDSERMAGLLDQAGYEPTTDDLDADVIVINTCSVREHAEDKLYTRLGELRVLSEETGHAPVVAVAGCVAQQEGDALLKKTNGHVIDVVVGTQRLKMLPAARREGRRSRRSPKSISTRGTT